MKPLATITAGGPNFADTMRNLNALVNYALKDRPFHYLDTVTVPEVGRVGVVYTVAMIFEVDTLEAIEDFNTWCQTDEQIRRMTGQQPVIHAVH